MAEGPAETDLLDLLIVGAGPAGIATAVEARRAGIQRLLLLEKGPSHSFSIEKLYTPGKRVDKVYLGQDVDCEGAVCIIDGTRETVLATLEGFVREYGLFDLTEPVPEGARVLVVGGGNTALEYVEYLYAGRSVTLAYRGTEFAKANEVNRRILQELEASGQAEVWRQAGVELNGRHPQVDHRYHASVHGLFLAGDLVAGGRGSIVKAFNTGRAVVWEGLCQGHLECRIPGAEGRL